MSYTSIFGNFIVTNGRILPSDGKAYAVYASELTTEDPEYVIPVLIYYKQREGSIPVINGCAVFLYGSIVFQSDGLPFLIEATNLFVYGVSTSSFAGGIIPKFSPRISVLGRTDEFPLTAFHGYQCFKVHSSASVKDEVGQNQFMALGNVASMDISRVREGRLIGIMGPICFRHGNGLPMLYIEAVTNGSAIEGSTISGVHQVRCGMRSVNSLGLVTSSVIAEEYSLEPTPLRRSFLNEGVERVKAFRPLFTMSADSPSTKDVECSDLKDLRADCTTNAEESRSSTEKPYLLNIPIHHETSSGVATPLFSEMNYTRGDVDIAEHVPTSPYPACFDPSSEVIYPSDAYYPQAVNESPRTDLVYIGGRACTPHPWNPDPSVAEANDHELVSESRRLRRSKSRTRTPLQLHGGHFDCNWRMDGEHRGRPRTVKRIGSDRSLDIPSPKRTKYGSPLKRSITSDDMITSFYDPSGRVHVDEKSVSV
ncbi:hypothetical protein M422DRAFT_778074 [Sphaerobolus stellatus SS14]|nr:hypothetical protein M422DRAFT_778074 [Sphaerobolus stellatus SS14]